MASLICHLPSTLLRLLDRVRPDRHGPVDASKSHQRLAIARTNETAAWREVDRQCARSQPEHTRFWWKHSGCALAVLLHNAGYSHRSQIRMLRFFANTVSSNLGASQDLAGAPPAWHSFMTDDGVPIELSWDWGKAAGSKPTIRYSVEPVSALAGTEADPFNSGAAPNFFRRVMNECQPENLDWYYHFHSYFSGHGRSASSTLSGDGHNTSSFYAFDLKETETTTKAYFFPSYRAKSEGKTNLQVITDAIHSAPKISSHILAGLETFSQFAAEKGGPEMDMLAFDLIDPAQSRIKIYFRLRDTTFATVEDAMTLSGRLSSKRLDRGVEEMRQLWDAIFDVDSRDGQSLEKSNHRTAGVLFNVEFKSNCPIPIVKLYMPVRHYARSDDAILNGLSNYLRARDRDAHLAQYRSTLEFMFTKKSMELGCGLQTYLGCSILPDGSLRLVSYLEPQTTKLRTNAQAAGVLRS